MASFIAVGCGGCPTFRLWPVSFIDGLVYCGGCPTFRLAVGVPPFGPVSHLSGRFYQSVGVPPFCGCPAFFPVGVPPFCGCPAFLCAFLGCGRRLWYRKSNPEIYFKSELIFFKISLIEHYLYKILRF
jgi:hypothetical protein